MWTTLLLAKNLICINFFASYHLKDEVVLVILPPFEWFRFITFLVSYTSALLHLLILVSNHFWSQHHLLVESGNSIWIPINFHHWHHKIGSLLVSMQDDCCQCYHSRRLGKSLHIPLSQCSAIPEYVNHLGFLTERFFISANTSMQCINFPCLFIHKLSFSIRTRLQEGWETHPIFINIIKELSHYKYNKKFENLYIFINFFFLRDV